MLVFCIGRSIMMALVGQVPGHDPHSIPPNMRPATLPDRWCSLLRLTKTIALS